MSEKGGGGGAGGWGAQALPLTPLRSPSLGSPGAILAAPSLLTSALPSAVSSLSLSTPLDSPTTLLHPLATVMEQATIIFLQDNCNTHVQRTDASWVHGRDPPPQLVGR